MSSSRPWPPSRGAAAWPAWVARSDIGVLTPTAGAASDIAAAAGAASWDRSGFAALGGGAAPQDETATDTATEHAADSSADSDLDVDVITAYQLSGSSVHETGNVETGDTTPCD